MAIPDTDNETAAISNAELAILSLVCEGPRHGYDLEQVIEERGMREWTRIGFSSIYTVLRKLEAAGLVEGRLETSVGPGPARKIFDATADGRRARKAAAIRALSEPERHYPQLMLGLANVPALSSAEIEIALQRYRESIGERIADIRTKRARQQPLPAFVEAMFTHSLDLLGAERRWLDRVVAKLTKQRGG